MGITDLFVRLAFEVAFRIGHRQVVRGLPVSVGAGASTAAATFGRLAAALDLLHDHDPIQYRAVRARLRGVLVGGSWRAARVRYLRAARACLMTTAYVGETTTPTCLAGTLVHETTHARIFDRGIRHTKTQMPRIESVCIRQQLAFVARVPASEVEVAYLMECLAGLETVNLPMVTS